MPGRSTRRWTNGSRWNFGDLSVHETANDPETNLAYVSYYRAGFRVLRFSQAGGLEEVGRFIDTRGNNLWGVHQMTVRRREPADPVVRPRLRAVHLPLHRTGGHRPALAAARAGGGPLCKRPGGHGQRGPHDGDQPRRSPRRRRAALTA